ncbi:hypothetical protein HMH01_17455 [Halovulum dunhuangense]|uniref:Surface antigen n=1 Tax=Halovulum dunhuangense TaxID=1505036 RepID=A0A849L730_9RHOB|nr:hypothetical protein [Halovulum dunhuangense]NNU82226.1 hypothetical protein [Halovulum dunhuangense]
MKTLIFSTLFSAGLLFAAGAAQPAFANPLLTGLARTGLSQADVDIMVREGAALYTRGDVQVGDDTVWSNPQTRAHGLVEVTAVAGDCVTLGYKFRTASRAGVQQYVSRRCRMADGRWQLTP